MPIGLFLAILGAIVGMLVGRKNILEEEKVEVEGNKEAIIPETQARLSDGDDCSNPSSTAETEEAELMDIVEERASSVPFADSPMSGLLPSHPLPLSAGTVETKNKDI